MTPITLRILKALNIQPVNSFVFALAALVMGLVTAIVVMILPSQLVILGCIGLPVAFFVLRNPQWGLYGLIFMVYTNLSYVLINYHGFPSVAKLFILFIFGVSLVQLAGPNEAPTGLLRALPFLILFYFVMFMSIVYAPNKGATLEKLDDYIKDMTISVTIIMLLQSGVVLKRTIVVLLLAASFICTISVYQSLTNSFQDNFGGFGQAELAHIVGSTSNYRVGGPVGSVNSFAHLLLLVVAFAFDRFANEKNLFVRALGGYALATTVLTIIFTYSRSAFLGLMVIAILMLVLKRPRISELFAYAVLIVFVMQFLPSSYTERLNTLAAFIPGTSDDAESEVSFRGRESENTVAWLIFHDHPLFGVGVNNYSEYYLQYSSQLGIDSRRAERTAHNRYLQILAEQGIVGFSAFVLLLGAVLRSLWKAYRRFQFAGFTEYAGITAACTAGFIGYMVVHFFIDDIHPRYFWMVVGIAFALPDVAAYEFSKLENRPNAVLRHGRLVRLVRTLPKRPQRSDVISLNEGPYKA